MVKRTKTPSPPRSWAVMTGIIAAVIGIAFLYWARTVVVPLALAVFLSFLLSPLVFALEQRGFGRVPSVVLVVLLATFVLLGTGWMVLYQATNLVAELPKHTENIKSKVRSLRSLTEQGLGVDLAPMLREVSIAWQDKPAEARPEKNVFVPNAMNNARANKQAEVVIKTETPAWLDGLPSLLGAFLVTLTQTGFAVVLMILVLLKREDLRERFIKLTGHGQITVSTKAVDDASRRISRYLLVQLVLNTAFGLALAAGLVLIGVDYAFLWGFLAVVLRYVPYLGWPIAAAFPIILSLAQFEGWLQPMLVMGLFLMLELVTANFLEPFLFGHSIGVSAPAILICAACFAFLWGPIGLVLSAPLTVCLVVLGKYVPQFAFLNVLLGDTPVLERRDAFYQRLMAADHEEAMRIAAVHGKETGPEHIADDVIVPALVCTGRDRQRLNLDEEDEQLILSTLQKIFDSPTAYRFADNGQTDSASDSDESNAAPVVSPVRLLNCPAHDEIDRLALEMLNGMLDPKSWQIEMAAPYLLSSELLALVDRHQIQIVCIACLPPGGLAHCRYLCKRLRGRFPTMKIVVGRWGPRGIGVEAQQHLQEAGADQVLSSILETRDYLQAWQPVLGQTRLASHNKVG